MEFKIFFVTLQREKSFICLSAPVVQRIRIGDSGSPDQGSIPCGCTTFPPLFPYYSALNSFIRCSSASWQISSLPSR